ncbi:MAG TPA: hypothetical protein VET48_08570 [Steroidobacteraceae bacterium]|nr:hypothetical protein [Steroidobacteraceae bacterium]
MSTQLLKPALYTATSAGPVLLGGICKCGYIFFPMQAYGCEKCGRYGDALQPKQLRGSGKLLNAAVVHLHADKRRVVPFAIGTIWLDDGPVVRTLLSDTDLANTSHARVRAELVSVTQENGSSALDLRFKSEGS